MIKILLKVFYEGRGSCDNPMVLAPFVVLNV